MKKILLATVAVLGFASVASAADLRPLPARPLVAPVYNWTSCYIGGYVGGAWSAESVRVQDVNGYNFFNSGLYDVWNYDLKSSFLGGGTLGCNWQPIGSPFVIGAEGEIGYLRLTASALDFPLDPFQSINSTVRVGDWYGMVTGRLGYAWDRALVYVKGGVAFVDVQCDSDRHRNKPELYRSDHRVARNLDRRRRHRVGVRLELERQGRIYVHRPG